jgi:hypothetical protein
MSDDDECKPMRQNLPLQEGKINRRNESEPDSGGKLNPEADGGDLRGLQELLASEPKVESEA